jgi:DNA-binding response OmpR family regulator
VGDVMVDLDAHLVFVAGAHVKCPPLQFVLLVTLARAPNRVIARESLLSSVWGALPSGTESTKLRTAISVLRGVLGTGSRRPRIEPVPHVGYRLVVDDSAGDAA